MDLENRTVIIGLMILVWCAALWDVRQRRVPNRLTLSGLILGLFVQGAMFGIPGLVQASGGLLIGFVALLPGYLLGATGAGDVKLMAAAGVFLGTLPTVFAAAASIAAGAGIALVFMLSSLFMPSVHGPWQRYSVMFRTLFSTGRAIYVAPAPGEVMGRRFPFAVSIAVGCTLVAITGNGASLP